MNTAKLWPAAVTVVGLVATLFAEPVHTWVMAHQVESMSISGILTIIANLMKSPTQG